MKAATAELARKFSHSIATPPGASGGAHLACACARARPVAWTKASGADQAAALVPQEEELEHRRKGREGEVARTQIMRMRMRMRGAGGGGGEEGLEGGPGGVEEDRRQLLQVVPGDDDPAGGL